MASPRNRPERKVRQIRSRPQGRRVLIVTEDSKSAPAYFRDIPYDAGVIPARVVVEPSPGSDPLKVARHLIAVWTEEARGLTDGELPFDRAFCVVDRDTHPVERFTQAREQLRQKGENVRTRLLAAADAADGDSDDEKKAAARLRARAGQEVFVFALSEPCFEYWLLLHYEDTRAPFAPTGTKSVCDTVVSRLKAAGLAEYAKGAGGLWNRTKAEYDTAKGRAERGRVDAKATGTTNPHTCIDEVVEAILDLGPRRTKGGSGG